ncbi:MAG: acyl-CoA dehydrogenase family protein [Dehalococcoidia bacterium]|nr:acyl-CoA dehydrogenase family protein [Dehalococcoidia bacterium]
MEDPVSVARDMAPRIRELAPRIERERRLPQELVDDLVRAGLMHLVVPRSLGGQECDPVSAAQAVEELARADGSTGWCAMLAAQSGAFSGLVDQDVAREVWGNGGIVAGAARPIGRAEWSASPRGYVLTGRWPFASGSTHATWFTAEAPVYDGDTKRLDAAGNEVSFAYIVPRADVTVHDTWDTTGLRGTASHDYSIDGAFVPERRAFHMMGPPRHPWVLYRAPALVFINHGSHALGVARAALAGAREVATTKRGWGGVPLSSMTRVQATVAEAVVLVESARTYLYGVGAELWQRLLDGATDEEVAPLRARVRLAASHAATCSVRATDLVHGAMGATSIFTSNPIERQFRDIHTAAAHVMIGPLTYEAAGRVELGLPPEFPFF